MKTLEFVNNEIDRILADGHSGELSRSKAGKNKRRLKFLHHVKHYLETNPSEDAVKRQLQTAVHYLDTMAKRYPGDENYKKKLGPDNDKNPRTVYNIKHGVGQRKKQIVMLKYILQPNPQPKEIEA